MNILHDFLQVWHWSVVGLLIGAIVPLLLWLGNKHFGISSTLRQFCAAAFPMEIPFFKYDWKEDRWNLFFVFGIVIGAFIAVNFLHKPDTVSISEATQTDLAALGITVKNTLLPAEIFNWSDLFGLKGLVFVAIGGFLIGFGTRWAGGCTSGHSIMGLANLQVPSLVATIFFFVGGLITTYLILPLIL